MSLLLPPLPPTFEAALRDVRARRPEMRIAAAKRLGQPEPEREAEALGGLLELSRDRDARVRGVALLSLAEVDRNTALPHLARGLDDDFPEVREQAALALVEIGGEAAAPTLRAALQNAHAEVRFQAALGYPDVVAQPDANAVAGLLGDRDRRVRCAAALSLARLDDARGAGVLAEALSEGDLVFDALDAIGALKLAQHTERVAAIADRILIPLTVKAAAARALLRLGDRRGTPALREVLRAFRSDARSYAVEVVGELRVFELGDELCALAKRPRRADLEGLARALATLAAGSEAARRGLATLALRADRTGEAARRALASESPQK